MYRTREKQMSIYDYLPPYHGELCGANRWVRLAAEIDWDAFEKAYSEQFAPGGAVALPARVALGVPTLTTVHQDAAQRAKTALACLEAMHSGKECEAQIVLPVTLIPRESTRKMPCRTL